MTDQPWVYFNPVKVIADVNVFEWLKKQEFSDGNILLITTAGFTKRGLTEKFRSIYKEKLIVIDGVEPNPGLDFVDGLVNRFSSNNIILIIAVGGGSVIDTAKVLSNMLNAGKQNPLHALFRNAEKLNYTNPIDLIAVPSTSGTGSEVTPYSTIWDKKYNKKHSFSGEHVYPKFAILDAELTISLPYEITLYTALDAISHALESLWNKNKSPMSQKYALSSLELMIEFLPQLLSGLGDVKLRKKIQLASMYSGVAISQTKTAIAHSISYPLTSHFNVPHGLACSYTLINLINLFLNECVNQGTYNIAILKSVRKMLGSFNLGEKMASYCSMSDVEMISEELISPQRAGNFSLRISKEQIKTIALNSLL